MIKKPIALIMGIVLVLTVISSAFLYMQGDQSGGVSSTNEPKYDYIVDNSSYYEKPIYGGARNGVLKTIGAACYENSRIMISSLCYFEVWYEDYIRDIDWQILCFYVEGFPFEIDLEVSGYKNYDIYICFVPESSPDEEQVECYLGSTSNIVVTSDMMPGYGGEECSLYLRTHGNQDEAVYIESCVIRMLPETYPSGVTEVVALPKNMLDMVGVIDAYDNPVELIDTGFIYTKNRYYVHIPVSLPEGFYTFSYTVDDDSSLLGYYPGDLNHPSSYLASGDYFYTNGSIECITLYRNDSYSLEAFEVTNVQLERGYERTEYTRYFEPYTMLTVPSSITSLPEYGVGSGALQNYLDLEKGLYVQTCKLVDTDVVPLDAPKVIDVSRYLPPGSGKLDLYGVGVLRFVSPYGTEVQTDLSYRRLIN